MIVEHKKDTELINGVIHEIKNPIALIKANIDLISLDCNEYSKNINVINKQLKYIEELTYNYLSTFKNIEYKEVNLYNILDNILYEYESSYENIRFKLSCSDDIYIQGDEKLLVILFKNIFKNAVEAINVKWGDSSFLGEIVVKIKIKEECTIVTITDNGIGYEDDREFNGNGVGLNIIKKIAKLHNGEFYIHNNLGFDGATQKIIF